MNKNIHERALTVARNFKRAEADLIAILQELDETRAYLEHKKTSLHAYAVGVMGLSDSTASSFIAVARKAAIIPALQSAIREGELTVSKARKITGVLAPENQTEWVKKAISLPCRKLEEEVARVAPREVLPESTKFVAENLMELRMPISKDLEAKLRQVQHLESQRTGRAVSLEDALSSMLELYLERNDPVRKAKRVSQRKNAAPASVTIAQPTKSVSATTKHEIALRDERRCTHADDEGRRCENTRWLEIHHIQPRSQGGTHASQNLTTLCSVHHALKHRREENATQSPRPSPRANLELQAT